MTGIGQKKVVQRARSADTWRRNPAMLTISIIFALLVLLWGHVGAAHVDR